MNRKVLSVSVILFFLTFLMTFYTVIHGGFSDEQEAWPAINLQGASWDIGDQYGEQSRELILKNLELFWQEVENQGLGKETVLSKGKNFETFMITNKPEMVVEIYAMSRSAGVCYEELLAFNALEGVVFQDGCTNLLATGSATIDGKAHFHKTRDIVASKPLQVIVERAPEGSYSYIGIANAGSTTVAMGVNEKGVSTGNTALTTWDLGDGYANHTINRLIMEQASTAAEAVDIIFESPRRRGANYHVADLYEAAFVETSHSAAAVKWVVDEAVANANHYTLPEMLHFEISENVNSSTQRAERASALLHKQFGSIDTDVMIEISKDTVYRYSMSRSITVSAATFDNENLTMYAQLDRPTYTPVIIVKLGSVLKELYGQDYMQQSILELEAPLAEDINGLYAFVRNRAPRWWDDDRSINGFCFLPLGSLSISYANIDNPRWAEYDISGRGYTHVKGYVGIADESRRKDYPLTFQIHGDGGLLCEEVLSYGENARFYLVDITDVEKLRFGWFAEQIDNVGANEMVIVEPLFLKPVNTEMLDAIVEAEAAIADIPEYISLLDEELVKAARTAVERAFALGVERDGRITNLDQLFSAEELIKGYYHQLFEIESLFELGAAESANSWWFGRDFHDTQRWDYDTNTGHTINRASFAPMKNFYTSYIELIENPRWAEWGIGGKSYDYVEGYVGISDISNNLGMPLKFTIYGDGEPLFKARLNYGREALSYRLDLAGVEKLKYRWQAATDQVTEVGAAERPAIVEPLFLHSPKKALAKTDAEEAIELLPAFGDISLEDEKAVSRARVKANNALFIGVKDSEISNLAALNAAEIKIEALKAGMEDIIFGDVDGNGIVNIADIIILLRHISGLIDLEQAFGTEALIRSRVSSTEGDPGINDAVLIMCYIVGLVEDLPVGI